MLFVKIKSLVFVCILCFVYSHMNAQSYRGIAVLNDSIVWLSGSKGTVIKTTNGGETWDTISPKGFGNKDFRDIHVFGESSAIIMSSGDSAIVLKTNDGGKKWKIVMSNNRKGVFLDAMDFYKNKGVIIGDPYFDIDSNCYYFDYYETKNSGDSWENIKRYKANKKDALYAASGTNIILGNALVHSLPFVATFVTGGGQENHLINKYRIENVPLQKGETCGIYSFAEINNSYIAVGGSYLFPNNSDSVAAYRNPENGDWVLSELQPRGYRSAVCVSKNKMAICTGTNGTDMSIDGGKNWIPFIDEGFNCGMFSDKFIWLAGDKGKWKKVVVEDVIKGK